MCIRDSPNIEYIIMDGGSTDETASIAGEYASRLTFISEKDRGQSHAINKGFRMARGEIVAWLNSDDVFLPGAIAHAAAALESRPECGAVYGEGYQIDRQGRILQRFAVTEPFNLWKLVHLSDYILQQTVFFRRAVLEEVGFLDEDLHYVMDWDILIRIGMRYPLGYIPEYMGSLREYPEAKSFAGGAGRVAEIGELMRRHTGRRVSPGYVVYGLDAYRRIWCAAVESRTPRWLKWPSRAAQWTLNRVCLQLIGLQIFNAQGWSRDGWASRTLRLMAPASASALVLRGMNPQSGGVDHLELRNHKGDLYGRVTLPEGPFVVRVPVPPGDEGPHTIEVTALARMGFLANSSRCYLLDRVDCETNKAAALRQSASVLTS